MLYILHTKCIFRTVEIPWITELFSAIDFHEVLLIAIFFVKMYILKSAIDTYSCDIYSNI